LGQTLLVDIVGLFPGSVAHALRGSILGRAQERGLIAVREVQLRDYAVDRHLTLDDVPYGGGAGMLLKPEPVLRALRDLRRPDSRVILLSADGARFHQGIARDLSKDRHLILLCGHYEGFDARIRHFVDCTLSLGDFVLTGGEPAAWAIVDAVARLVPGVLKDRSLSEESFDGDLLEAPQFTRPPLFQGIGVPEILRSGDHGAVERYRRRTSEDRTRRLRGAGTRT
jgi:tRNA (guanine37-N1)-methyltransferase